MRKKVIMVLAIVMICVLGVGLAACGGKDDVEQYSVTWNIDENATVTAEGYDTLPSSVDSGTTVSFSVSCVTGYEVSRVAFNDRTLYDTQGTYSFTVRGNSTVDVTSTRTVTAIEITNAPDKLTYFAGDELDTAGMIVTARYAVGDPAVITDYTVYPTIFEGGETYFTVSYSGKNETVQLTDTVEYLVTLNPNGGEITAETLAEFETQHNYKLDDETGIITFSYYDNIEGELLLPTSENMTKKGYKLMGWTDQRTSIKNEIAANLSLEAIWDPELVTVSKVYMEIDSGVPYLKIEGTFVLADEAYLYLYEGNDNISLNGTTVQRQSGDDSFELIFDLTELSAKPDYISKWMDIRFNASFGDEEVSQQIYIPTEGLEVNPRAFIVCDGVNYIFSPYTHPGNGLTTLKVWYNEVDPHLTYTIAAAEEEGVPTLTIEGKLNAELIESCKGGTVSISWYHISGETQPDVGTIAEDGTFTVKIDLSKFSVSVHAYAHVTVRDAESNVIYGGTNQNLVHYGCTTELPQVEGVSNMKGAIKFTTEDGTAYYIGYNDEGSAGGLVLWAQKEEITDGE